jgi:hypothetical protein
MDTFRRLFSCGPIFAKKTEEEEGDAAKEVPLPPHSLHVALLPMLADADTAAAPCSVGASVPVFVDPGTATFLARAGRCRCPQWPRRRSTTRRSAQVSAPTLPARSRPRSRPPARRLARQRAQRCVSSPHTMRGATHLALAPDQWCAALAADAAAERRDAQPVVRDARGGAGREHATKPSSRQPRLMGHSARPHTPHAR